MWQSGPLSRFEHRLLQQAQQQHTTVGAHMPAAVGMPGWQITLIAIAAARFAATAAVLLDRARMARLARATSAA